MRDVGESAPVDPWLLAKLVCPVTRTSLRWDGVRGALISDAAGLAYPVRDGVPVLLAREASVI
ncbi:FIG002473: Protein YcaR in KDO2-Lipid A biosynthesis cluster [Sphingobium indicum BiD32]|uniref:FIG002473: Protein YcaR in KDO2-Lipid A biosynthesis cluster n=1 Tax=Sphingobium indicum BiD32 TaxID=1301087 RepID=N1MNV5_9SPHN|nr:Trm112 family protein [Sphingobium indicum]CCW17133.1 FIG002473: Protein YcaR in KDO2-Lipid A biosynthesis cluster [Sphingobium indicum BiD32]